MAWAPLPLFKHTVPLSLFPKQVSCVEFILHRRRRVLGTVHSKDTGLFGHTNWPLSILRRVMFPMGRQNNIIIVQHRRREPGQYQLRTCKICCKQQAMEVLISLLSIQQLKSQMQVHVCDLDIFCFKELSMIQAVPWPSSMSYCLCMPWKSLILGLVLALNFEHKEKWELIFIWIFKHTNQHSLQSDTRLILQVLHRVVLSAEKEHLVHTDAFLVNLNVVMTFMM